MIDDGCEFRPALRQIGGSKLTFKDGVLEMVAEPPHKLEDFAKALVVADVVTLPEIRSAHSRLR